MKIFAPLIRQMHRKYVLDRRVRMLAQMLSAWLPDQATVLDIGCGSGAVGSGIMRRRPDVAVRGIDVLERQECSIECDIYDGRTIPLPDSSVDVCLLVDVLHHTQSIEGVLAEASRVSRKYLLIKDHLCETGSAHLRLKVMDWVGNRPHGVVLTYNYKRRDEWKTLFSAAHLKVIHWTEDVPLYPVPLGSMFGRGLHFIALLQKE